MKILMVLELSTMSLIKAFEAAIEFGPELNSIPHGEHELMKKNKVTDFRCEFKLFFRL
jgi:hypothetical protein